MKISIDEILESDLLNKLVEQDNKDLKDAGWTYEEIKELVKLIEIEKL